MIQKNATYFRAMCSRIAWLKRQGAHMIARRLTDALEIADRQRRALQDLRALLSAKLYG